ncbi:Uma2 family endonuclease [Emticicia sp. SJ17W-69]|uniref:Uma2 family endonuclease n=1 Tax=Emticicia sp. SJ17W-69 TaxID=3421657 RepID=UPI003EBA0D8B
MVLENEIQSLPKTLAEFMLWEPNDGFKYEWNDGELIKFDGMNKKQVYIYNVLNKLFSKKGYIEIGSLVSEYDVKLTGIQMRRPDIAYLTDEQILQGRKGEDVIPEFVIEIISETDQFYKIEDKITEYFKAGVKVIWNIVPEHRLVYIYTSRKTVKICSDNDICSAEPVLPDFAIAVNDIFTEK